MNCHTFEEDNYLKKTILAAQYIVSSGVYIYSQHHKWILKLKISKKFLVAFNKAQDLICGRRN